MGVATPLNCCKSSHLVAHVKAMPGNPDDGRTLATVIRQIKSSIGNSLSQIVADAEYRRHNAPKEKAFKVYVAGQKRDHQARLPKAFNPNTV